MISAEKYSPVLFDKNIKHFRKFQRDGEDYARFWREQKDRLINGYKPTGGTWIPGNYYFYLNFSKIHGLPPGAKRKTMIPPLYRDQDHEYYMEVFNAKENHHGIIVLKARRKGFSFMNANILLHEWTCFAHSENGLGAQKEDYVQDFRKKMLLSYNELPPQLRNKILHNNEELFMSGYKEKEDGIWIEKGTKAMVHFRVMEKPNAFRGTSMNYMVFEEAGEFLKLKRSFESSEDCFKEGDQFFGTPIIGGTSNNMEIESDDYMEMYYNAERYNLKPVFIKSSKVFGSFFDMSTGKSDVAGAELYINKEAERRKESGDIQTYYSYLQENPLKVEHAFFKSGSTPFDLAKINQQIGNIMTNKNFDVVRKGRLEWGKDAKGKQIFGSKPVWVDDDGSLDEDNPGRELFPFEMIEEPIPNLKNAHVSAVDPYHVDEDLEEMKKGKSKNAAKRSEGSMCVYRRFVDINTVGELPVAFYTDRPYTKEEFYENCLKLAIFYDSQILVEYNDDGFLKYFVRNKMTRYLKERPRSADAPYSTATNRYGVHMKGHQKRIVTDLLDDYIKNHWEDLLFLKLLNELAVYGKKNTDRVMAFGMALMHNMDVERKIIDSNEEDQDDKMHIPHFKKTADGGIVSVHRGTDGQLQKSGRKPTFDYDLDDDDY